eukprot:TRINITY_DN1813_c0_g1_i1.p1 TRINITY_DN1813_c0_g1~~TRINITY_DN1813_c0_g1_i1.p1  ORF type:complete len:295 (+),score=62.07 TRINITY_DN1813_c0_g1_i1:112-885(+)
MECERARERLQLISDHLTAHSEGRSVVLSPLRCRGISKSVTRRYDNMVLFARQGSASQGYFMRQVSVKQYPDIADDVSGCDGDNKVPGSNVSQFQKVNETAEWQRGLAISHGNLEPKEVQEAVARRPFFSKPSSYDEERDIQVVGKSSEIERKDSNGWQPRMDVAEFADAYVFTIELSGVNPSSIRVEVNDKRLTVSGKRSIEWGRNGDGSIAVYHKRELAEGPYRITWNIPHHSNLDFISAEFVDGFLQITIPKEK